jgi:predicted ATP-dependent endonuclease of OLD family
LGGNRGFHSFKKNIIIDNGQFKIVQEAAMYKKIKIENFRGISQLQFNDLKQFNLIVGKNNSCKTTVLESIFLLTGPTNFYLPVTVNSLRGLQITNDYPWALFFSQLNNRSHISLYGEIKKTGETVLLLIKSLFDTSIKIPGVTDLHAKTNSGKTEPVQNINGISLDFSITGEKSKEKKEFSYNIRSVGKELQGQGNLNLDLNPLKGIFIHANYGFGDNTRRFNQIQIKKQGKKILKILQKIEPDIQYLSVGSENILYCDVGFNELVPVNIVGDGINRLLSIVLAIYEASNGVVLIDEVENGFHYSALELLWKAIFESAREFNVQVFATTHSNENIKSYSSAYEKLGNKKDNMRLYRLEKEEERLELISIDHEMLKTTIENGLEIR